MTVEKRSDHSHNHKIQEKESCLECFIECFIECFNISIIILNKIYW